VPGVTAYELGRLVGTLLIPIAVAGIGVWLAVRRKRANRESWWIPLAVTFPLALVLLIAATLARLGDIPRDLTPEAALVPLQNFTYGEDPVLQRAAEQRFRSDPTIGEDVTGIAMRRMQDERGQEVAILQVLALEPAAAVNIDPQDMARGVAEAGTGEVRGDTIEGQPVSIVATQRALTFVLWPYENLFVIVTSGDEGVGRRIASEMIRGLGP
jgi:hypothetical protein